MKDIPCGKICYTTRNKHVHWSSHYIRNTDALRLPEICLIPHPKPRSSAPITWPIAWTSVSISAVWRRWSVSRRSRSVLAPIRGRTTPWSPPHRHQRPHRNITSLIPGACLSTVRPLLRPSKPRHELFNAFSPYLYFSESAVPPFPARSCRNVVVIKVFCPDVLHCKANNNCHFAYPAHDFLNCPFEHCLFLSQEYAFFRDKKARVVIFASCECVVAEFRRSRP